MRGILDRLAQEALNESVYPNPAFPPSPYYRFLKLLVKEFKPNLSVELGVSGGGGSLHLAMGHTGKVIGIDFLRDHEDRIKYIEDNYPNFEFMLHDSTSAAPKVFDKYGKVDILFIDTDHTYDTTMKEYNAWKPYLSDNAIIILDDLDRDGMTKAFNKIEGNKVVYDFLNYGHGLGVVYLKPVLVSRCKTCG
jgi:predicted O-methyltransferase YrrM